MNLSTKSMPTSCQIQGKRYEGGKTMKSSNKDEMQGKWKQVKGKIKEFAGKVSNDPELEFEGKAENTSGKVQEKVGEVKKVFDK
jgi:uncharacterized protein YjbJ (UPF0337 family)